MVDEKWICFSFNLIYILNLVNCQIFPFQNTSLPFEERVNDLVKRLTVDEIVLQMTKGGSEPSPAITRYNISQFQWNTECLRGDVQAGNATSFPQAINLAASFNPDLVYRVAEATSVEVRAKHNYFMKKGLYSEHKGINCFGPVINIMRHPLWGRNQETYGEDPYLSGMLAESFVKGLQGNHPRFLRTNAVCKHFAVYGGPDNIPALRLWFDAKVSEKDLRTTFLPQFKACVDAGAGGLMCSYNSINGVPACANKELLTNILRKEWGFKGFVISDSGAVEFVLLYHWYTKNEIDTAVSCADAGLNLELSPYKFQIFSVLNQAVDKGLISEELLLDRVKPLFMTRMRLGEFDPPENNPYNYLNMSVIQSPSHQRLSLEAAIQSFVLLKNRNNFLPLIKKLKSIAIVGPMADNPTQIMGDYAADVDPRFVITPKKGLSSLGSVIHFAPGCTKPECYLYNSKDVINAVSQADVTFLCLGTGQDLEAEMHDRIDMSLPGQQHKILNDVIHYANGAVVLILFSGGPLDIQIADSSDKILAILQCFFPAQSTGIALQMVLTMATPQSNPSGRLPYTWYKSEHQVPSMTDYSMTNRTYRYFNGDPLYPFGYGLSYTSFQYSDLDISPVTVTGRRNVTVTFKVTNIGLFAGSEVTQMYISWLNSTGPTPRYQLAGFQRKTLGKGVTEKYSLNITSTQLDVWVGGKGFVIEPGKIAVYVGGQLPNQKKTVKSNILTGAFSVIS